MLAILQPFCPPALAGIARSLSSGGTSAQATVTVPVEQVQERTAPLHPLTGIVAEPEAKQVILEMLQSGTPESVIRSIFNTGYYEIVIPHELSGTPYIAITYTNDIEEGHIYEMNSLPAQDLHLLTTPNPGMTADERGDWEEDQAWDGFQWGSIGYCQDSGEVDLIPSPVLYTIAEFQDLEPVSGLEIYFSGCDSQSLDLCAPEPWYRSNSPGREVWIRDWSDEYELGDVQSLDIDGDVELEQDSSASSESGDLDMETEFTD